MAVMLSARNLRDTPDGETTTVTVPEGKKVEIIDRSNSSLLQIRFSDGGQDIVGWVPALAVKQDADDIGGPLDKLGFAEACVRKAISWGASAHYLMAVAEMRTQITDGPNANGVDIGPYALS